MQRHDAAGVRRRHDLLADVPPFLLQRVDAILDQCRIDAAGDGVDQAVQFAHDLGVAAFQPAFAIDGILGKPLPFVIIGLHIFGEIDRPGQLAAQAVEGQPLDSVALHAPAVGADAAFAEIRALQSRRSRPVSLGHHAAAAETAADQSRQHAARLRSIDRVKAASARLTPLGGLPDIIGDDAQMRRVGGAIGRFRIWSRDALAGGRVFDHPHLVPDDAAGIEVVQQQARSALHIAVDGRGVPRPAARWRDAAGVEPAGDVARRAAGRVVGENLSDDIRLGRHDLQLAGLAGNRAIAIGASAGVAAGLDDAVESAADMHHQILDEQFTHQRPQGAVDLADLAAGGVDRDAEKVELLARGVPVALIARDAIDVLGDQHIESLRLGVAHHRLEARPVHGRRSRHRAVLEGRGHRHALARAQLAAERDLIGDRSVVLQVG